MKFEADVSVVRAARLLLRRRRTDEEEEKEEERGTDEGGDVFSAFCCVVDDDDDDDDDAFEEEEDGVEDEDDGKKKKKKKTMWTGSEDGTIVRWQNASFTSSSSVTRTTFFPRTSRLYKTATNLSFNRHASALARRTPKSYRCFVALPFA